MLPETRKGAIFIRVARLGGLVMESHPLAPNRRVVEWRRGSSLRLLHFRLVDPSL
jgi:hypothetical protein